ncbi:hypothetical protein BOSE21B_90229 [Bosea sp. 21B]|nr:hypothetical protein BOSE21B_90229 [Bosea sp. 21B]CAD5298738.1 hypothetical protein BOSE7B_60436 [Bosea sp. 7B]VXB38061.1 hypothetical protein BOSE127_110434 [Bosea sp. 127]
MIMVCPKSRAGIEEANEFSFLLRRGPAP